MNIITNVTLVSTNINKDLLKKYQDYYVIDKSFKIEDLLNKQKIIFFNVFNELEEDKIKEIYQILIDHQILFINYTNNMEEALLTKYLIIYDKENILLKDQLWKF